MTAAMITSPTLAPVMKKVSSIPFIDVDVVLADAVVVVDVVRTVEVTVSFISNLKTKPSVAAPTPVLFGSRALQTGRFSEVVDPAPMISPWSVTSKPVINSNLVPPKKLE